tara:strand:- start:134 stop:760 length:627 start_codon:yes stop_codon:yes gene_type:complete
MRQHVNPLSNYYDQIIPIPPLNEIFKNPNLPLHLDLGSASGDFLFKLALQNQNWNYIGIEIREKLVTNANLKLKDTNLSNLFFAHGNAINLIKNLIEGFCSIKFNSISIYFPDPWFKKKHHKRRIIQDEFIFNLSKIMPKGAFVFVKSDVLELFQYIELTFLNSSLFLKVEESVELKEIFNPKELKTNREDYVIYNGLPIFEQIYFRK